MLRIREALEASWDVNTAYKAVERPGNPALGQCYPTARVVQHYFPESEIIKGKIWTSECEEIHFWNAIPLGGEWIHVDLSWKQFPPGSIIREFVELDRSSLGDTDATLQRCDLLLKRVRNYLDTQIDSTEMPPIFISSR